MRSVFVSFGMTSLILAGCTMIPDYMRPEFSAAQHWPNDVSPLSETERLAAQIEWPDFFRSAGMRKVIETTLKNNRDLLVAALNVEAARAAYGVERSALIPDLGGNASATYSKRSDETDNFGSASTNDKTESYEANIGISGYELDLFGRIRSLNKAALEEFLATKEARKSVRIALIAETANTYLQLMADRKALNLTRLTLEAQQHSFDLINRRYEEGIGTKLDLSRAATSVEAARVNLAIYKRRIAQGKNALVLLMGTTDAEGIIPETETLDDVALIENLPVGLPSEVLLLRPDIRQAEHELLSANADIGAARTAFFPRITLTGDVGFASNSLSSLFDGSAWSFVPQITVPIFTGGFGSNNLDLAEIRRDIKIVRYEQAIRTGFREVADTLAARETLDDQLAAQSNLVEAARDAYEISDARYKAGVDNFLSVLDAQRELFAAELGLIDVRRQWLSNLVNMYRALGGGAVHAEAALLSE